VTRSRSTARSRLTWITYAVIIVSGAALAVGSIPALVRFLPGAPREFWLLWGLALLVETTPLVIPHGHRQPSRPSASLCITFAIMLLWGAAVAIVVQVLALGVAALRVRQPLSELAFNAARFSLAFQAAWWSLERTGDAPPRIGVSITELGIATLVTALVWLLTDLGLILLILTAAGRSAWRTWMGPPLYYYMAANAGLLTLSPVLFTAPTGWMVGLLAVPLALFGIVAHLLRNQEAVLSIDPVTGQQSLRGLEASVERLMTPDALSGDMPRLGLLLVRLSDLGEVTNVFGRTVTGRLLRQTGERITVDVSSEEAVIGRIAAADFVVVLPGADVIAAKREADVVAHGLLTPIDVDGVLFRVRPTIGIAVAPEDGSDLGTLAARAETAIMDPARAGFPADSVHDGDVLEAQRRLSLLVDLRAAIERPERAAELSALYQPQVRISDGQLVGVEALARWEHPERGLVDTADMIMTAEASGVMQLLTRRILDDALAQLAAWSAAGLRVRMSVNVSAKDFADERFAEEVRNRLLHHAVAPDQLELEITETALAVSTPEVDRTIADVVAMGVGLSLDDFGTGFASLHQIRRYPLRELKIDRSYVMAMATSPADHAVVTSVTRLATDLGLHVVAEGVEDAQTAAALGEIGPIIGQGWYYGRPMSASDLMQWINARHEHD
jgi:predicted signal transduction protein with EAL and GGDEF domain